MKYAERTALGQSLQTDDWDAMVDRVEALPEIPADYNFKNGTDYTIWVDGADYYANDAYHTVFGGATDEGAIDGADLDAVMTAVHDDLATGGLVRFGRGTFPFADNYTSTNQISYMGMGTGVSILSFAAGKGFILNTQQTPIVVRDLELYGASDAAGSGLTLDTVSKAHISDVYIHNFLKGVNAHSNSFFNTFTNLKSQGNGYGVYLEDIYGINRFFSGSITYNTKGVYIGASSVMNQFYGTEIEVNDDYEVSIEGDTHGNLFEGCYFERTAATSTYFLSMVEALAIGTNTFRNCKFASAVAETDIVVYGNCNIFENNVFHGAGLATFSLNGTGNKIINNHAANAAAGFSVNVNEDTIDSVIQNNYYGDAPVPVNDLGDNTRVVGKGFDDKILTVPTHGWTESVTVTGSITQAPFYTKLKSGAGASSTAVASCIVAGLNTGDTFEYVNFDKWLEVTFIFNRLTYDTETTARFQLKQTSALGDLVSDGIGVFTTDVGGDHHLYGQAYGTALQNIDLGVITSYGDLTVKIIVIPGYSVNFFVNGDYLGRLLTTAVPAGESGLAYLVASLQNGVGATDTEAYFGNVRFRQGY